MAWRRSTWFLAGAAWLCAVGAGFATLYAYTAAPGEPSRSGPRWPDKSQLPRAQDRATLVMFVHPHCACSRASLSDLDRLVRRVRVQPVIAFIRPSDVEPGWENSDLRQIAARIPDARLWDDLGGQESRRFGAATSGATLLYDAGGKLLFSGGLTDSRGHPGDSFGEERVVALLGGVAADRHDSPVFGCPLEDPAKEISR